MLCVFRVDLLEILQLKNSRLAEARKHYFLVDLYGRNVVSEIAGLCQLTLHRNIVSSEANEKTVWRHLGGSVG